MSLFRSDSDSEDQVAALFIDLIAAMLQFHRQLSPLRRGSAAPVTSGCRVEPIRVLKRDDNLLLNSAEHTDNFCRKKK
jgi:hypothetical protein